MSCGKRRRTCRAPINVGPGKQRPLKCGGFYPAIFSDSRRRSPCRDLVRLWRLLYVFILIVRARELELAMPGSSKVHVFHAETVGSLPHSDELIKARSDFDNK